MNIASRQHISLRKAYSLLEQRNLLPIMQRRNRLQTLASSAIAQLKSFAPLPENLASGKFGDDLEAACAAVRLASKLCQNVQRGLKEAEKTSKDDSSPVTVADYGAQVLVAWCLSQSSPGATISMVAEEDSDDLRQAQGALMLERITALVNEALAGVEGKPSVTAEQVLDLIDLGNSNGGSIGKHWVLDPIDGTRGFVGMRQYAVCLGLLVDGQVELGVLGCPNLPTTQATDADGDTVSSDRDDLGCIFLAHNQLGAYVQPLWGADITAKRIHVNDVADFSSARFMESYESRHSNHNLAAAVAQRVGITSRPLRMDSQVKYGLLARGDASIYMRFPPPTYREKIWDHCAGFCIVEEAGGKITDGSGARLDFSKGRWLDLDNGIVAAPPRLHQALLAAIQAESKP